MNKRMVVKALVLGTLVAAFGQFSMAQAQSKLPPAAQKDAVIIQLTQKKVVAGPQGDRYEDASAVKPGDVIEYRATYTNVSKQAVQGLVAKLPVPEGLEYLPKSAKPFNATLQMAGRDGQFGIEPLQRKAADGSVQMLPFNEYRTMRWNLGQLQAGASVVVSARAKVESASPAVSVSSVTGTGSKAADISRP